MFFLRSGSDDAIGATTPSFPRDRRERDLPGGTKY
jgi:hypothetical protein